MIITRLRCFFASVLVGLVCASCTTPTKVSSVWKNPNFTGGSFESVLVLGVASDSETRAMFENALVEAINGYGLFAAASHKVIAEIDAISEASIRDAVVGSNVQLVAVTTLLEVSSSAEYSPVAPSGYWDSGIHDHYLAMYGIVYERGYYETSSKVQLLTNVYSAKEEEPLIWSGRSETANPESLRDAIVSATQSIAAKMVADRLVGQ